MWWKCTLHHEPGCQCSSLVKSEPAWLHPEVLGFEADRCLWCILVDRAIQSLQMEIFACFQCFHANLHLFRVLLKLSGHRGQNRSEGQNQIEGSLLTS